MASTRSGLPVAVTGPTGTLGFALMAPLEADARVGTLTGIARRPFAAAAHGWTKMRYRRGDVRDPAALEQAFAGADVDQRVRRSGGGGRRALRLRVVGRGVRL